ncbi:MAG: hypothetical protein QM796_08205 [Chthoniobacteraceae bacterium]
MTAVEIIKEIKQLSPDEREEVVRFIQTLEQAPTWSGTELNRMAEELAHETDPALADDLKRKITAGFYGDSPDA